MTANRILAELRGINEATCLEIDQMHEQIDACMHAALDDGDVDEWSEWVLNEYDYKLQALWGFQQDERFHTLYKKYLFKKQWYNRTFQCNETGETFTIPFEVQETDCYYWGKAMLDVGRLNAYSRFSNCTEAK